MNAINEQIFIRHREEKNNDYFTPIIVHPLHSQMFTNKKYTGNERILSE